MNKVELAKLVAEKTKLSQKDANAAISTVFDGITAALGKGESFPLIGFGTFKVTERSACTGRNPKTGQEIKIPSKKVVKFTAGKALKEKVQVKEK